MARRNRLSRVYLCYPFNFEPFKNPEIFRKTLQIAYRLGYVPIVATPYLSRCDSHAYERGVIRQTIYSCDYLLLCYEEHITEIQLWEIYVAMQAGIPVIRSIAL
jgi:hypothetical protein